MSEGEHHSFGDHLDEQDLTVGLRLGIAHEASLSYTSTRTTGRDSDDLHLSVTCVTLRTTFGDNSSTSGLMTSARYTQCKMTDF